MELQAIRKNAGASKESGGRVITCRLKAAFSKVINLESGKEIYAVQTEDRVFTPLSVTVAYDCFKRLALKGTRGIVELDLSRAKTVDCHLHQSGEREMREWGRSLEGIVSVLAKSGSLAEAAVERLWRSVMLPAPWQSGGRSILEHALSPMREGCPERAAYILSGLSGLGPGLTPAGDDFLLGALAVCRCWREEWCPGFTDALKAALAERGSGTSWLSRALLSRALEGEFALPIHRLFKAGDRKSLLSAAAEVTAWGHTSGSDTIGGIVWMAARAMEYEHSQALQ